MQLHSVFEIEKVQNISIEDQGDNILIEGVLPGYEACPNCNNTHIHKQNKAQRLLHLPPVGTKKVQLSLEVQKQRCVTCKRRWWPKIPFTRGKERMSESFIRYALELLRFGTIKDVSQHLGISWDVVKGIHKKHLETLYLDIDMAEVEYISIDEFSIAKRHKYMTTIMDIKTGRILYAVEGRKKEDIEPAFQELKKKHPNLKLLPWI